MNIYKANLAEVIDDGDLNYVKASIDTFRTLPNTPDIEYYLKNKSIDAAQRKTAITYLIYNYDNFDLLGYFTLTHKAINIETSTLSRTLIKKIAWFSSYDDGSGTYTASAFLLAQFGKNYALKKESQITGSELMDCVNSTLKDIQYRIGGKIVYLDVECGNEHAFRFYSEKESFRKFGERVNAIDQTHYYQMLRLI